MSTQKDRFERFALGTTKWVGSPASIVLHTLLFAGSFSLGYLGFVTWDRMLLVLTTIVSLEAIYLSIFIQMSLNYATKTIEEVEVDIDEIQEDIDEIQEDVDEIQEDIDEIQEDVDEIQEDVEDIGEADEADLDRKSRQVATLDEIRKGLEQVMEDLERYKKQ
jgi:uncharacterized protein YoxC